MPDYDWSLKSSPDAVNSDSSLSMSPLPQKSHREYDGIIIKEEIIDEDGQTVMISDNGLHSIELHNYSSGFSPMSTSVKRSRSDKGSSSTTSSTNSSPNARKSGSRARGKPITELTLTDEEKRLLSKEGYADFPMGSISLTKLEEKILRKVRRKIRNKRSAQCSRQRKKEYVEELEKKFEKIETENDTLKREMAKLRKENSSLMVRMKNLVTGGGGHGQTSLKTSFFVLVLSFLLVLVPFFRPDALDTDMLMSGGKEAMATGRHLLMTLSADHLDGYYAYGAINESVADSVLNITTVSY